jgi:class 3 adenylate cyclase
MIGCPSCGYDNRPDRRYCAECGEHLGKTCRACETRNEPGEKFCGNCGAALGKPSPAASAPGLPRERGLAVGSESVLPPAGERRQLTVVFCDLADSTALAAQLDPEDWREVLGEYQRTAGETIERFGGYVAKRLGDGLLAYFGWPQALEDDGERAVRAGLGIREAVGRLSRRLTMRLAVRVGMDTGAVVIGEDGEVYGDAPNIAARVQGLAEPGTVLITAATYGLVSGLFVVEDGGTRSLKGVSDAVRVYRVVAPSGLRGRLAAAGVRGLTPFVGREVERRLLRERWDLACEGEGQLVLITGEAGIGKSRLVQQFRADLGDTPHTWIECTCSPYLQHTPFGVVAELLAQGFQWSADLPEQARAATVADALVAVGLDPRETAPHVASLLGLPPPEGYPSPRGSAEQQRRRLMATIVQWTLAAARRQPAVLVLEDLNWIDPSTLELVGLLLEQAAAVPMLVIVTARPEFQAPWKLRANHTHVTLGRLTRRQAREMVAGVTARVVPSAAVVEALVARTDGVPLFVEEVTRAVLEGEGAAVEPREIPMTLHDSLMARLDRLGEAKRVAQVAAVIGREVPDRLLRAVAGMPDDALEGALRKLVDADLVHARGLSPEVTYFFKHALVQEAAYASLLKSRRRDVHRRVAEELTGPGGRQAPAAVVAQHWEAAGEAERAAAAWQQAAEQAQCSAAAFEAEGHYRRALAAIATLPDGPARVQRELPLQIALAGLLQLSRSTIDPAVQEAIRRADELAAQLGDAMQAVLVLSGPWGLAYTRGEQRAAEAVARQMVALAERDGGVVPRVLAHVERGMSLVLLGDLGAGVDHLTQALVLYRDEDFRWYPIAPSVMALTHLVDALWLLGRTDEARRRERELLAAAERRAVASDTALAELQALLLAALRRESGGIADRGRRLLALCKEQQQSAYVPAAQVVCGWALACGGEFNEGIALLREGLKGARESGQSSWRAHHLALLVEALVRADAQPEALAALDEAFDAIRDEEVWRPDLLRLRGDLLARTGGDAAAVEASYREAIDRARLMGAKAIELRAAIHYGRWLRDRGRTVEGRALLAPLCAALPEGFDARDLVEANALLEELG